MLNGIHVSFAAMHPNVLHAYMTPSLKNAKACVIERLIPLLQPLV